MRFFFLTSGSLQDLPFIWWFIFSHFSSWLVSCKAGEAGYEDSVLCQYRFLHWVLVEQRLWKSTVVTFYFLIRLFFLSPSNYIAIWCHHTETSLISNCLRFPKITRTLLETLYVQHMSCMTLALFTEVKYIVKRLYWRQVSGLGQLCPQSCNEASASL